MRRVVQRECTLYATLDLDAQARVDVRADLTDLPWRDGSWDTIVCSHVLEHVPDDARAMKELRRVLAPGGHALVLVPQDPTARVTIEDLAEQDPRRRAELFGQDDHVRLYGLDLLDRLAAAGFVAHSVEVADFSAAEVERSRLELVGAGAGQAILVCT